MGERACTIKPLSPWDKKKAAEESFSSVTESTLVAVQKK